eukprot:gene6856-8775_t
MDSLNKGDIVEAIEFFSGAAESSGLNQKDFYKHFVLLGRAWCRLLAGDREESEKDVEAVLQYSTTANNHLLHTWVLELDVLQRILSSDVEGAENSIDLLRHASRRKKKQRATSSAVIAYLYSLKAEYVNASAYAIYSCNHLSSSMQGTPFAVVLLFCAFWAACEVLENTVIIEMKESTGFDTHSNNGNAPRSSESDRTHVGVFPMSKSSSFRQILGWPKADNGGGPRLSFAMSLSSLSLTERLRKRKLFSPAIDPKALKQAINRAVDSISAHTERFPILVPLCWAARLRSLRLRIPYLPVQSFITRVEDENNGVLNVLFKVNRYIKEMNKPNQKHIPIFVFAHAYLHLERFLLYKDLDAVMVGRHLGNDYRKEESRVLARQYFQRLGSHGI